MYFASIDRQVCEASGMFDPLGTTHIKKTVAASELWWLLLVLWAGSNQIPGPFLAGQIQHLSGSCGDAPSCAYSSDLNCPFPGEAAPNFGPVRPDLLREPTRRQMGDKSACWWVAKHRPYVRSLAWRDLVGVLLRSLAGGVHGDGRPHRVRPSANRIVCRQHREKFQTGRPGASQKWCRFPPWRLCRCAILHADPQMLGVTENRLRKFFIGIVDTSWCHSLSGGNVDSSSHP